MVKSNDVSRESPPPASPYAAFPRFGAHSFGTAAGLSAVPVHYFDLSQIFQWTAVCSPVQCNYVDAIVLYRFTGRDKGAAKEAFDAALGTELMLGGFLMEKVGGKLCIQCEGRQYRQLPRRCEQGPILDAPCAIALC